MRPSPQAQLLLDHFRAEQSRVRDENMFRPNEGTTSSIADIHPYLQRAILNHLYDDNYPADAPYPIVQIGLRIEKEICYEEQYVLTLTDGSTYEHRREELYLHMNYLDSDIENIIEQLADFGLVEQAQAVVEQATAIFENYYIYL